MNDKKVFFLGAGFSKAIDSSYPLMNELAYEVVNNIQADKNELEDYFENQIPSEIKWNTENLLAYLSADLPFKTESEKFLHRSLYSRITRIISKKFLSIARNNPYESKTADNELLRLLATYIYNNHENVDFITLNYDILIERIFWTITGPQVFVELDKYYSYPIVELIQRFGNTLLRDPIERNFPKLLKLHGSANWWWANCTSSDMLYCQYFNEKNDDQLTAGLEPFIIPPVLDKNAFYNHIALKYFWDTAHKLLTNAKEIYIVGFSFPQTDLAVRFLFQSALRKNLFNPKIYIINSSKEVNLEINYKTVFKENMMISYEFSGTDSAMKLFLENKLKD